MAARESRRAAPVPITEIRVATDTKRVNPDVIKTELSVQPGDAFTSQALDSDLKRLFGRGDFDQVDYSLVDEDGKRAVLINATEKSWGPNYIKFGLGLYTDFQDGQRFNLLGSYRRTWLNSLGAEWRTDAQVGFTNRFVTEFYQPLGLKYVGYVAPRIELQSQPMQFFFNNQLRGNYGVKYARGTSTSAIRTVCSTCASGPSRGGCEASPGFRRDRPAAVRSFPGGRHRARSRRSARRHRFSEGRLSGARARVLDPVRDGIARISTRRRMRRCSSRKASIAIP